MIVYHGSNMKVATPFVHLGRNNLDFGKHLMKAKTST